MILKQIVIVIFFTSFKNLKVASQQIANNVSQATSSLDKIQFPDTIIRASTPGSTLDDILSQPKGTKVIEPGQIREAKLNSHGENLKDSTPGLLTGLEKGQKEINGLPNSQKLPLQSGNLSNIPLVGQIKNSGGHQSTLTSASESNKLLQKNEQQEIAQISQDSQSNLHNPQVVSNSLPDLHKKTQESENLIITTGQPSDLLGSNNLVGQKENHGETQGNPHSELQLSRPLDQYNVPQTAQGISAPQGVSDGQHGLSHQTNGLTGTPQQLSNLLAANNGLGPNVNNGGAQGNPISVPNANEPSNSYNNPATAQPSQSSLYGPNYAQKPYDSLSNSNGVSQQSNELNRVPEQSSDSIRPNNILGQTGNSGGSQGVVNSISDLTKPLNQYNRPQAGQSVKDSLNPNNDEKVSDRLPNSNGFPHQLQELNSTPNQMSDWLGSNNMLAQNDNRGRTQGNLQSEPKLSSQLDQYNVPQTAQNIQGISSPLNNSQGSSNSQHGFPYQSNGLDGTPQRSRDLLETNKVLGQNHGETQGNIISLPNSNDPSNLYNTPETAQLNKDSVSSPNYAQKQYDNLPNSNGLLQQNNDLDRIPGQSSGSIRPDNIFRQPGNLGDTQGPVNSVLGSNKPIPNGFLQQSHGINGIPDQWKASQQPKNFFKMNRRSSNGVQETLDSVLASLRQMYPFNNPHLTKEDYDSLSMPNYNKRSNRLPASDSFFGTNSGSGLLNTLRENSSPSSARLKTNNFPGQNNHLNGPAFPSMGSGPFDNNYGRQNSPGTVGYNNRLPATNYGANEHQVQFNSAANGLQEPNNGISQDQGNTAFYSPSDRTLSSSNGFDGQSQQIPSPASYNDDIELPVNHKYYQQLNGHDRHSNGRNSPPYVQNSFTESNTQSASDVFLKQSVDKNRDIVRDARSEQYPNKNNVNPQNHNLFDPNNVINVASTYRKRLESFGDSILNFGQGSRRNLNSENKESASVSNQINNSDKSHNDHEESSILGTALEVPRYLFANTVGQLFHS